MPDISLCMIVLNEAELLPRALANLAGFHDELIIVDTGSSDDTVAIAKEHGAQVLHYDWRPPGHKGEARNLGIDAARGEWIVVLDADEIIRDPAGLRQELLACDNDAVAVTFWNVDEKGKPTLIWRQTRCFRRGAYTYLHREHEIPIPVGERARPQSSDVIFVHDPPAERRKPKIEPMLERLRLDVEERPDDTHARYFYARQLLLASRLDESIEQHTIYLEMADPEYQDVCEVFGNLASCCHGLGRHQEAIDWLYRALARQPKRRSWWVRLADIYLHINEVNLAQGILHLAQSLWPIPEVNHEPKYYNGHIDQLLMQCEMRIMESWQRWGEGKYYHGEH